MAKKNLHLLFHQPETDVLLKINGKKYMAKIRKELRLPLKTVVEIINKFEQEGLIVKTPYKNRKLLSTTTKGKLVQHFVRMISTQLTEK